MSARRVRIRTALLPCRLGALTYITVRGVSRSFPDPVGAPLHWRQNADLSGLNILTMGIFYEALQRWGPPSLHASRPLQPRGGGQPAGLCSAARQRGSSQSPRQAVLFAGHASLCPPCHRWVGDAKRVLAMAKTVVGLRLHPDSAALTGVRVPDHVDVLAEMACGPQAHMVFSAVTGGPACVLFSPL